MSTPSWIYSLSKTHLPGHRPRVAQCMAEYNRLGIAFLCNDKLSFSTLMSNWCEITTSSVSYRQRLRRTSTTMCVPGTRCFGQLSHAISRWLLRWGLGWSSGRPRRSMERPANYLHSHMYMMWPSQALYGHSKCDLSGVHGRNQLRWPQLDFTPDLTCHRFLCSAIIIHFQHKLTQQLPWCDPIGGWLHFEIKHGINIHLHDTNKGRCMQNENLSVVDTWNFIMKVRTSYSYGKLSRWVSGPTQDLRSNSTAWPVIW